ncbi:septal ring lytic transglycosylase RlpA family protein [Neolewinella lacunae]|uniref:Septal ring lytic transglycosylase RlpA family protein n=1 Tax=Neolewinella lacunae TaxID=1517758 RepID=A0A923PGS5_9BACT|nr:septal ring lytic transglycosylase RlpA family protein [Neolewinella lacunae]MBC6992999.1 septal ring lytic transglycosylase RlpA family protein [Neolewinella lacunae]MDN3635789.1 septal ring lytic transglycosylase RlpA family protein [Neolewinella lacunae]
MKYVLSLIAFGVLSTASAQNFEWNTKSAAAHPNEVQPGSVVPNSYDQAYNQRQMGLAGMYNPGAHGSRTAYGETYSNRELTASHGLLPLGTMIRVTNLENNQAVTVRVNDRGQECADCLVMLSQAAATQLGINYRARVSVERIGFSNWNPAPAAAVVPGPADYNHPQTYAYTPAQGGVVRPVTVDGQTYGWDARGGDIIVTPPTYGSVPSTPTNYATLNAPANTRNSVMSREVTPSGRSGEPLTYSRYPGTVTPQATNVAPPVYQPVSQPQAYGTYPSMSTEGQQPAYQPVPRSTSPGQVAPPAPTVQRYQSPQVVATPQSYGTPAPATYQMAKSVEPVAYAAPTVQAASPVAGYVVQIGAYNNELYAKNRVTQLAAAGLNNVFYLSSNKADGQVINRVYVGTFSSMAEAQTAANDIRNTHQIAGIVTRM